MGSPVLTQLGKPMLYQLSYVRNESRYRGPRSSSSADGASRLRARELELHQMVTGRRLQPPPLLLQAGATLIYLASLSAIAVHESQEPRPLVIAFFAPSVLAGLVIGRFWAVALPLGVIAISRIWVPLVEEAPVAAMVGGLLTGVALDWAYEKAYLPRRKVGGAQDAAAHRWPLLTGVLRRILTRDAVDGALDRVRFRIDTFPHGLYQPIPSLPARAAARRGGSESRWSVMLPIIQGHAVRSAIDIGACEGYFSLELAAAGIPTIAIESDPSNYRTALYAVRRSGTRNVGVLAMEVTPENVITVPPSDCVLCLSVWHHFVRSHGLSEATEMLEAIWLRTRKVMFFDSGETEMTPDYRLPPMTPDPRSWLTAYLAHTCDGSRIDHLGRHRAFDPAGNPCERNLFAVVRSPDERRPSATAALGRENPH